MIFLLTLWSCKMVSVENVHWMYMLGGAKVAETRDQEYGDPPYLNDVDDCDLYNELHYIFPVTSEELNTMTGREAYTKGVHTACNFMGQEPTFEQKESLFTDDEVFSNWVGFWERFCQYWADETTLGCDVDVGDVEDQTSSTEESCNHYMSDEISFYDTAYRFDYCE